MCRECLARHHSDCWEAQGACASCSGGVRLVEASAEAAAKPNAARTSRAAHLALTQGCLLLAAAAALTFRAEVGVLAAVCVQLAFSLIHMGQLVSQRERGSYARLLALTIVSGVATLYVSFGFDFLGLVLVLPFVFLGYGFVLRARERKRAADAHR